MTSFVQTLESLIRKSGVSAHKICRWTGLDPGYLSRLRSGQRQNPSRDVVLTIGLALFRGSPDIETWHVDELLDAAGYAKLKKRGQDSAWPTAA